MSLFMILAVVFVCIYGATAAYLYYGYSRKMTL